MLWINDISQGNGTWDLVNWMWELQILYKELCSLEHKDYPLLSTNTVFWTSVGDELKQTADVSEECAASTFGIEVTKKWCREGGSYIGIKQTVSNWDRSGINMMIINCDRSKKCKYNRGYLWSGMASHPSHVTTDGAATDKRCSSL
jgi:hypothetical protein